MKKLSLVLAVMLVMGVSFAAMDKMTDKQCDMKAMKACCVTADMKACAKKCGKDCAMDKKACAKCCKEMKMNKDKKMNMKECPATMNMKVKAKK